MIEPLNTAAAAGLGTYALHSTLLLALAWIVTRRLRSARASEVIWRAALVGGLFSASAQLALADTYGGLRWTLGAPAVARVSEAAPAPAPPGSPGLGPVSRVDALEQEASLPASVGAERPEPAAWAEWAVLAWAAGGALLLTWLLIGGRRLASRLAGRRPVREGVLVDVLGELCAGAGLRRRVRLTVAPGLSAPLALGVLRPEICVPRRALGLAQPLARTMLAHELAHLKRLDPLWLGWARLMETLFFFQPLNRVARRRLGECAEFACDAWAVRQTGDRLGLARCLAEVAGWLVGERPARPACAMADLRSPLGERVERILDERAAPESAPAWLAPIAAGLLSATATLAPGFAAPASGAAVEAPREPAAAVAPTPDGIELFFRMWEGLRVELDRLDAELETVRQIAATRELSQATLGRLELALSLAAQLREREETIGALLAAWQARAQSPMDAR